MSLQRVKCLLVVVFSVFALFSAQNVYAGGGGDGKFDPGKAMLDHIADAHEFHFFTIKKKDGTEMHGTLPLPVILYSPQKGLSIFSSAKFHHGHDAYNGYRLQDGKKIVPVLEDGVTVDEATKVYDFSITKNVAQMILASIVLFFLMKSIAKRYRTGQGVTSAPKGVQNLIEPIVLFVQDDVAKPALGHNYKKYLPFLLTLFFFIFINNIFGLIPNMANVTGNIGFTAALGLVAFIAIIISTNKHFWGHIFWYPGVPVPVKLILLPVELLSVFTKPFSLVLRLFANLTAGHIIILSFVTLIFIFAEMSKTAGIGFTPVSIAFGLFIYLIELLVAFIQAYIFTNLTAVFISQAIGDHGHEKEHAH